MEVHNKVILKFIDDEEYIYLGFKLILPSDFSKFDFYNILPNNDKDISDREATQALKNPASIPQKEVYFYQVGAFNSDKDADNTKAKLALLGFEAVVLTAPLQNNEVVHKVRVGPLTDDAQIMKTKNESLFLYNDVTWTEVVNRCHP